MRSSSSSSPQHPPPPLWCTLAPCLGWQALQGGHSCASHGSPGCTPCQQDLQAHAKPHISIQALPGIAWQWASLGQAYWFCHIQVCSSCPYESTSHNRHTSVARSAKVRPGLGSSKRHAATPTQEGACDAWHLKHIINGLQAGLGLNLHSTATRVARCCLGA
jgi:hypothetical protein